jgi:hypothetical protein
MVRATALDTGVYSQGGMRSSAPRERDAPGLCTTVIDGISVMLAPAG